MSVGKEYQQLRKALQIVNCPECAHPPIHHVAGVCVICLFFIGQGQRRVGSECHHKFEFRLTQLEREQAMAFADKSAYDQYNICGECAQYWCQHHGMLCPSGDSTFTLLIKGESHKIV